MELKKNEQYDLEKKSPLFFSIGLVVAILCVILAFEWRSEYSPMQYDPTKDEFPPTYIPPITAFETPKPPKPVEIKPPKPSLQPPEFVEGDPVETLEPTLVSVIDISFDELIIDNPPPAPPVPTVFERVESMPSFPGGIEAFYKHVGKTIKYPRQAKKMGIMGKVFVQFIIDTDGSITEVSVMKGIGAGCDEEAVRVIESAPAWNPGKQRGRPVKVRMVLPITFSLSDR